MKTEQEEATLISEAEYLKQYSTLLTNFTKDVFEIYQKAVGHYNWIKGVPVVEIREKAYNIARFRMDDHMSLHKTGHYDGEGLDNFWRLHELYRNELYLKSQLQQLQEEKAKSDSEVKTLREAAARLIANVGLMKVVSENRKSLLAESYHELESALQSKGGEQ